MDNPKPHFPECHEGPEAARRFTDFVRRLIAVPREEIKKREEAWKKMRKTAKKERPSMNNR